MARTDKAAMPPARSCKPRKLIRGRPQLHAGLIPLIHAEQAYVYFTAGVKLSKKSGGGALSENPVYRELARNE